MFISTMNDASVIPARPRVEFHAHVVRTIRSAMGPEDLLLTAVGKPDGFKPPKIRPGPRNFPQVRKGDAPTGAISIRLDVASGLRM